VGVTYLRLSKTNGTSFDCRLYEERNGKLERISVREVACAIGIAVMPGSVEGGEEEEVVVVVLDEDDDRQEGEGVVGDEVAQGE
jgi:hypothetical protein